ncbi:hypothetical protein SAMN05660909_03348 [Chitinophaga terrae (ex Kim and Jung 2007)]|uniref:Uncharacterized protein n=1 Tax=Chitinophaga terrae (ex Kim and Jung 2007) TaxID=408074 RepID=A0A1H4DVX6_9BACT|nr:DUF5606 domain-containing protein [Chitinophaga terrae (ex Kim and Jung 2007)]MDQ0104991.1 hypothetical protein [Chitinophaga terrae (ex Kim and Jung 2007)]GEP91319.1 hypothetical protein CTE07_29640 [Chitinophaga terrae (ex Kim and Jung 2007)]SEA76914.1 hypothetical protein SAMN05660909_03348 [Chitinophaga terrae (ex Kim and Jung 2007)]
MQYREIVAVTGLGGLFQLIASKQDGAIVRSLEDKSTKFVSSRVHNFTPLESIEVFTTGENVNLAEVFKAMDEKSSTFAPIDGKADNNAIKAYFKNVFPEFDEDRVYVSDMKKMVKWFGILKANDLLKFDEILASGEEEVEEVAVEETAAPEKKKKAAPAATEEVAEEKPKKTTRAKKADKEEGEEGAAEKAPKKTKAKKEEAPAAEGEEAPKKAAKPRKKKTEE